LSISSVRFITIEIGCARSVADKNFNTLDTKSSLNEVFCVNSNTLNLLLSIILPYFAFAVR
jgi:hypothetical protein